MGGTRSLLERTRKNGWIPRCWRGSAADGGSSPLQRDAERTGLPLLPRRERLRENCPFPVLTLGGKPANFFPFVVHPLTSRFLSGF